MKKVSLIVCFFVFIILISSCDTITENLDFSFDTNGNYTGFNTIPENYTPEQAIEDGCYVRDRKLNVGDCETGKKRE